MYEKVDRDHPSHAKVLQQLGRPYHQGAPTFQNRDLVIHHLSKPLDSDSQDISRYIRGRAYRGSKAHGAHRQEVYYDRCNPTPSCMIRIAISVLRPAR